MNRFAKVIALVAVLAVSTTAAIGRQMVVMTYNVHNGVGLDKKRDHGRIARIIERQRPDIVAIEEVDSATCRSGRSFVLGEIARGAGMQWTYAPAISYDGGLYGIGLLSGTAPDSVDRIPLPGREESRMMLVARYPDCIVIGTHLSLTPDDALASVQQIDSVVDAAAGKPVILMGDLNSLPDSPVIEALLRRFAILSPADKPTFPATNPTERIDYVMITKDSAFEVKDAEVIGEDTASDHRPIVVRLTIADRPAHSL